MAVKSVLYELTGNGDSKKSADKDLSRQESDLQTRLKGSKVSSELEVHSNLFKAHYQEKPQRDSSLEAVEFTVQSQTGWEPLVAAAKEKADGGNLEFYDSDFSHIRSYNLTPRQGAVATRVERTSPPAGIQRKQTDYLVTALTSL